jgi:hypothetical protein
MIPLFPKGGLVFSGTNPQSSITVAYNDLFRIFITSTEAVYMYVFSSCADLEPENTSNFQLELERRQCCGINQPFTDCFFVSCPNFMDTSDSATREFSFDSFLGVDSWCKKGSARGSHWIPSTLAIAATKNAALWLRAAVHACTVACRFVCAMSTVPFLTAAASAWRLRLFFS